MNPLDYPIFRFFLEESEKMLRRESYLGLMFITGVLSELIVREIADDTQTHLAPLLKRLLKSHKISQVQYQLFDEIRKIRNRYVHIKIDKMVNNFNGIGLIDSRGVVTFLNEIVKSSLHPEEKVVEFLKVRVKIDSQEIMKLLKKAVYTFQ